MTNNHITDSESRTQFEMHIFWNVTERKDTQPIQIQCVGQSHQEICVSLRGDNHKLEKESKK